MPPPLMDEMIDYEDGTPCNISQMVSGRKQKKGDGENQGRVPEVLFAGKKEELTTNRTELRSNSRSRVP